MKGYYAQVRDLLVQHGWRLLRQGKGSHEIWHHPNHPHRLTVPHNCASRHTANGVLKDAGIDSKV